MLSVLVLLSMTACEYIPFSSGALTGTVVKAPADWSTVAAADIVRLETNPSEPYSVNLWVVALDGDLFVHAGANHTTWVQHIESNPSVRLGVDGNIYQLNASRVTDQALFDRFAALWQAKYDSTPRNMNVDEAYLIRLSR